MVNTASSIIARNGIVYIVSELEWDESDTEITSDVKILGCFTSARAANQCVQTWHQRSYVPTETSVPSDEHGGAGPNNLYDKYVEAKDAEGLLHLTATLGWRCWEIAAEAIPVDEEFTMSLMEPGIGMSEEQVDRSIVDRTDTRSRAKADSSNRSFPRRGRKESIRAVRDRRVSDGKAGARKITVDEEDEIASVALSSNGHFALDTKLEADEDDDQKNVPQDDTTIAHDVNAGNSPSDSDGLQDSTTGPKRVPKRRITKVDDADESPTRRQSLSRIEKTAVYGTPSSATDAVSPSRPWTTNDRLASPRGSRQQKRTGKPDLVQQHNRRQLAAQRHGGISASSKRSSSHANASASARTVDDNERIFMG
ncbi:hypothetical protein PYCC9005_002474 [Savitreella phatthalungensis]